MRGIKTLNILLMLTIIVLITASSANAAPQGTVIKGGVLTYPAGPYLKENLLLINLENYTVDNNTQTSAEPVRVTSPEKESQIFNNNSQNITSENLSAWNFLIYPSNPFYIYCKSDTGVLHPYSLFLATLLHLSEYLYLYKCYFSAVAY